MKKKPQPKDAHKQALREVKSQWRVKTGVRMPEHIAILPLSEIHKRLAVQRSGEQVAASKADIDMGL